MDGRDKPDHDNLGTQRKSHNTNVPTQVRYQMFHDCRVSGAFNPMTFFGG